MMMCQGAVIPLSPPPPPPCKRSPHTLKPTHFISGSALLQQPGQGGSLPCGSGPGWKASSSRPLVLHLQSNNRRIARSFFHPRQSARRHGGTHAASNVSHSAAAVGATVPTSRRLCCDWLSKPTPSPRSATNCSYNLQEYGVLKEDAEWEY